MALLRIPDPNEPPNPIVPFSSGDEYMKILIRTVNELTKKIDELEERIRQLERR